MEQNENKGKHKTIQNTSPTARLMDPMIEPSQEYAWNNIIRASKTSISSSTSIDYVLFQRVSVLQVVINQRLQWIPQQVFIEGWGGGKRERSSEFN